MKEKKDVYCGLEHFMKYGCVGCKLSRKCEEYYENGLNEIGIIVIILILIILVIKNLRS